MGMVFQLPLVAVRVKIAKTESCTLCLPLATCLLVTTTTTNNYPHTRTHKCRTCCSLGANTNVRKLLLAEWCNEPQTYIRTHSYLYIGGVYEESGESQVALCFCWSPFLRLYAVLWTAIHTHACIHSLGCGIQQTSYSMIRNFTSEKVETFTCVLGLACLVRFWMFFLLFLYYYFWNACCRLRLFFG